jgi:hypothetical protein
MRYLLFLFLLPLHSLSAQTDDPPPPQIEREAASGYRDSVARHEGFGAILHYMPHLCQNRYRRYGWVDKYHKVIVPFEYELLRAPLTEFTYAQKSNRLYGALDARGHEIIPFRYTGITPWFKQKLVTCTNGPYRQSLRDFQGRIIIPEDTLNIYAFDDTSLVARKPNAQETPVYNLRGEYIKTWPYKYIYHLPSGRYKVAKDTSIGWNSVSLSGLLDADGAMIVPMQYTDITWEQGDWARVSNYKTKTRGLYRISTQTLHPDTYYHVGPPDPLGNFTFWIGESSERTRAGLMDAQFKVIFPPAYRDIRFLDERGHYVLHAGPGNRGDRCGVGNAEGQIVIDTVLVGFKPMVHENKVGQNDGGQWIIEYDTLPFLIFEDIHSGKYGLWHRQAGRLRAAAFDRFDGVSPTTFIQEKGDTAYLFHTDGRLLAGPYYRIWRGRIEGYLLARPNWNDEYILLDLEGRFIRNLEGEPQRLADGFYIMGRYGNKRSGYGQVKEYGLFDRDLNPITGLVFDLEPQAMDGLNTRQKIRVLDREHPAGYGPWVGYMREGSGESFLLIDRTGKTYEITPD